MAFRFPFSTLHELNLDWILEKVKTFAELIPPMESAVEDVQTSLTTAQEALEDATEALESAGQALETAEEAKEIAEQAAQGTIADGAVTTAKLADGSVTTVKLADGAVTGNKIDLATIQTGNLSEGCVTSNKILDGTVDTVDLHDGAVTLAKLAPALRPKTAVFSSTAFTVPPASQGTFLQEQSFDISELDIATVLGFYVSKLSHAAYYTICCAVRQDLGLVRAEIISCYSSTTQQNLSDGDFTLTLVYL